MNVIPSWLVPSTQFESWLLGIVHAVIAAAVLSGNTPLPAMSSDHKVAVVAFLAFAGTSLINRVDKAKAEVDAETTK